MISLMIMPPSTFGQRVRYDLTFERRTSETDRFLFTFAADPYATDDLDTSMGEKEIPDIPLPGDIFYVWTIAPISTAIWLSPIEIRPYPIGRDTMISYDTRVNWTGGTLEVFWTKPLPSQIDSIWITDGYSDFPDNFVKAKVETGTRLSTTNPAIDRFKVLIWYNGTTTSVDEERNSELATVKLYPNPTTDVLMIDNLSADAVELKIVNTFGQVIDTFNVGGTTQSVDLSDYAQGQYLLVVTSSNGFTSMHPFIRR